MRKRECGVDKEKRGSGEFMWRVHEGVMAFECSAAAAKRRGA